MKLFTTMMACALCACASPAVKQARVYDPNDYKPPTDLELTVNDNQKLSNTDHPLTEVSEYQQQQSLIKVNQAIVDQQLQLQMCGEVHGDPSRYCYHLLNDLCQTDAILDARGDMHWKPYCTPEYIKAHKPHPYRPKDL